MRAYGRSASVGSNSDITLSSFGSNVCLSSLGMEDGDDDRRSKRVGLHLQVDDGDRLQWCEIARAGR